MPRYRPTKSPSYCSMSPTGQLQYVLRSLRELKGVDIWCAFLETTSRCIYGCIIRQKQRMLALEHGVVFGSSIKKLAPNCQPTFHFIFIVLPDVSTYWCYILLSYSHVVQLQNIHTIPGDHGTRITPNSFPAASQIHPLDP